MRRTETIKSTLVLLEFWLAWLAGYALLVAIGSGGRML